MLLDFKEHLNNHFSFLQNKKVLIAISGGIDSVVLAHLCHQLGINFILAHCNFKLRGIESDEDEAFVVELANTFGKEVVTTSFDTEIYAKKHKLSIQVAARNLRYEWFQKLLEETGTAYVLTAHNTNDNLETFIINLTRGSGLEGFTGIPVINDRTVRPLLAFSRDQIMMYAIKNSIVWREDRSNASVKYVRNKVRHQIIPVLQEINPNVLNSFKKTLEHLQESQDIIDSEVAKISKKVIERNTGSILKFNISELKKLSNVKAYLYQILKEYAFTEWDDIVRLLSGQSGKQVFSKNYRLLKDRDYLLLTTLNKNTQENRVFHIHEHTESIDTPISLHLSHTNDRSLQSNNSILVDKDLLKFPLNVRKWSYGDYICPKGMKGTKKLSQFFKDRKLSLIDKENVWLLTDANDDIIWIIGMRQDRRFHISNNTHNILKIATL